MYLIFLEDQTVYQEKELSEESLESHSEGTASIFSVEGEEFVEFLPGGEWSVVEYL